MANYFIRKADLETLKQIKFCAYCGSSENLVIDHIHPRNKGGGNELSNLTRACNKCNLYKSDFDIDTFLNRIIEKRGNVYNKALSIICRAAIQKRRGHIIHYISFAEKIPKLREEHSYYTRIIQSLKKLSNG